MLELSNDSISAPQKRIRDAHGSIIGALLTAVRSAAGGQGIDVGHVYLPAEPAVDAAIAGHFERSRIVAGWPYRR